MKLKISKLSSKQINTQYGPKQMVSFQHNGQWYSAFQNQYTDAWENGMEIEVDVVKNGKYNNIQFPKESNAPQSSGSGARILKELADIKQQLAAIASLLNGQAGTPMEEPPVPNDEDFPL